MPITGNKRSRRRNRWRNKPAVLTMPNHSPSITLAYDGAMLAKSLKALDRAIPRSIAPRFEGVQASQVMGIDFATPTQDMQCTSMIGSGYAVSHLYRPTMALAIDPAIIEAFNRQVELTQQRFSEQVYQAFFAPSQCSNCHYYHGQDGVNCALHPSGPEGDCGDWEQG